MKCHVSHEEPEKLSVNAEFAGKLTDAARRLTEIVANDLLCMEIDLELETLVLDDVKDGKRILVWHSRNPLEPWPIRFEFTE